MSDNQQDIRTVSPDTAISLQHVGRHFDFQDRETLVVLQDTLEHLRESHVPDSLVTLKRVEAEMFYMEQIGELKKGELKVDPSTLFDMRFVKKAVEKYPPAK